MPERSRRAARARLDASPGARAAGGHDRGEPSPADATGAGGRLRNESAAKGHLLRVCDPNAAQIAPTRHRPRSHPKKKGPARGTFTRALCRTRTGDPFLTMEVLYQLS